MDRDGSKPIMIVGEQQDPSLPRRWTYDHDAESSRAKSAPNIGRLQVTPNPIQ